MKDNQNADMRQKRAHALRAIRALDKPFARLAIRRWRIEDEQVKAIMDALTFGGGMVKVMHVPRNEFLTDGAA